MALELSKSAPLDGVVIPSGGLVRPRRLRVRPVRILRTAVAHGRTRAALRLAVRHAAYVVGGAGIAARRAWHGRTVALHQQMIRSAVAAGNHELAAEWQERADRFRQQRHQRRMDLMTKGPHVVRSVGVSTAGVQGALLAAGIAWALSDGQFRHVIEPLAWELDAIRWACVVAHVVWGPALAALPWAAVASLWALGQSRQAAPSWALPARGAAEDVPITPSIVVKALSDLGISALRRSIKEMSDAGAGMLGPIVLAGCGVEVDVTLPSGVSTEEILLRRRKLAENLHRHEHELHMTLPPAPRTVRMWIADSGALDEPIGGSPLMADADVTADFRKGRAPWGQDLRSDAVLISLWQRMVLVTGLSNQGKTAALRALALWAALDPSVDFWIGDLKGVGDWNMFTGLASVLIQGPTDEHVIAVTEMVEAAVDEMGRRIALMRALTAKGWSQDKILADPRFRPLVVIVDEAQVAYGSGAVGDDKRPFGGSKATSRYFQGIKRIHDQGRAVSVTTWEGTQDPTDQNLPKRSREGNHIRASLVLGTESQARMAVGDAAVDAGAAPHKLRQGLDKGTLVVAGDGVQLAPGQPSVTVRTHYIGPEDAVELAELAKARRTAVETRSVEDATPDADPLSDIAAVLGEQSRMRTDEVRQRLAELNPGAYRAWTAQDLTRVLETAGAAPYKSSGLMVVSRERVLEALAERSEERTGDHAE